MQEVSAGRRKSLLCETSHSVVSDIQPEFFGNVTGLGSGRAPSALLDFGAQVHATTAPYRLSWLALNLGPSISNLLVA